jgi:hypothetical protein
MCFCIAGGAQSGRAAAAEKQLEKMKAEGLIPKPFVPKKRSFLFPPVEKMGQSVVTVKGTSKEKLLDCNSSSCP